MSSPPTSNVAGMPADPTSGPEAPPADELAAAEATLRVLQQVVHGIAADDLTKPTPCREFDVAALTDHPSATAPSAPARPRAYPASNRASSYADDPSADATTKRQRRPAVVT